MRFSAKISSVGILIMFLFAQTAGEQVFAQASASASTDPDTGKVTDKTSDLPAPTEPTTTADHSCLSPTAQDIAKQINVLPLIEKLEHGSIDKSELARLKAGQNLNTAVLIATLQVRDVTARIERELAIINRLRGLLEDRRDRAIKLNSIENIGASGAMSEIANGSTFMSGQTPANVVNLVAGAATIGLGSWALRQQSGAKQRIVVKPNMLAKVFNHATNKDSEYPPVVWDYLNSAPVGTTQTRLQALMDRWRRYKVIPNTTVGPVAQRRIAALTNSGPTTTATIDIFNDQSDMLFDLRSEIYQLDRDLLDLMQCVQPLTTISSD